MLMLSSLGGLEVSVLLPEIDLFDIINPSLLFLVVVASARRFFCEPSAISYE
jgi:hypothetical protein